MGEEIQLDATGEHSVFNRHTGPSGPFPAST
jgi:hypothetical protein